VLLNAYVTKLTALADSDQPAAELESAKTIEPAIAALPQTFSALGSTDPTAGQYVAPVNAVLGWLGAPATDAQRQQATSLALQTAAPAASKILDLLTADLKTIQSQRTAAADGIAQRELTYYNTHLHTLSLADRTALLTNVEFSNDAEARAQSDLALSLLDQLRRAHQALLTYVASAHTEQDEAQLGHAMADFEAAVLPLAAAAHPT